MDSCRVLEQEGFEVTYLPVQSNGIIRLEVITMVAARCGQDKVFTNHKCCYVL